MALEAAPSALVVVDGAGRIALANSRAEDLFGYSHEELLDQPIEILVPEEFRAAHPASREHFMADVRARAMGSGREFAARHKSGRQFPVEIGLNTFQTREGTFVMSAIVDITKRKSLEERFCTAAEAAPTAMIMVDSRHRIILVNRQAEKLFGYSREQLIGKSGALLMPELFREPHAKEWADLLRMPRDRRMGKRRELHGRRRGGTEVPVEVRLSPVRTQEGTFVLSTIVDITERRRNEMEREDLLAREQAALQEARAANRAKDDFLGVLSHELRTPLNAILGWVQQLREGGLDEEQEARALEVVERNAQRQTRLVSDLLDVSRVLEGKLHLELGAGDLVAIVEEAVAALRPTANARKIRLRSVLESVPPILGDRDRLHQVVWNLLSNAIKFTPRGGWVEVELTLHEVDVQIRVSDNGCGIPPDQLSRVFDRFFQVDSSGTRQHGGLGLGLAVSRHLVELHGGWIRAESPGEGQGTIVTVSLPASSAEEIGLAEAQAREAAASASSLNLENALENLRVLVVDDEEDTRDLLLATLRRFGAEVVTAGSVSEALATLDNWLPDVLVSDIAMPGSDGYSLLQRIRARDPERGGQIPALALTAYAGSDHTRKLLEAGFRFHVAKPFDLRKLIVLLSRMRTSEAEAPE